MNNGYESSQRYSDLVNRRTRLHERVVAPAPELKEARGQPGLVHCWREFLGQIHTGANTGERVHVVGRLHAEIDGERVYQRPPDVHEDRGQAELMRLVGVPRFEVAPYQRPAKGCRREVEQRPGSEVDGDRVVHQSQVVLAHRTKPLVVAGEGFQRGVRSDAD